MLDGMGGGFDRDEANNNNNNLLQETCELPAARTRRVALRLRDDGDDEDEDEDDLLEEEEDARWVCPICPLADRSTRSDRLPPCIAEFREALISQPRRLPELAACRVLSALFNRTCYAFDQARPETARIGVTRILPTDVRAHLIHTRHLRENEEHMLDDRIWYTLRLTEQLERTGLWFESAARQAKLDRGGFADWCKAQDVLKKLIETRQRFHGQGSDRERGGIQKRRYPTRYHYSRTG